jgi:hypothetical protein
VGPIAVGYDKWWSLDDPDGDVVPDLLAALERGLEHVEPIATDEGLRDALLRLALSDPRGLPPVMEAWTGALIRRVGPGGWAKA